MVWIGGKIERKPKTLTTKQKNQVKMNAIISVGKLVFHSASYTFSLFALYRVKKTGVLTSVGFNSVVGLEYIYYTATVDKPRLTILTCIPTVQK